MTPITYLTFEDVNGRPSSREELRQQLSKFARDEFVVFCCYLNSMLFGADYQMNWELHDELVRTYLRSSLLSRRSQVSQNRVWILHRQAILFLAKEACVVCGTTGLSPWNSANELLSTTVLMANDQLGNVPPSKIPNENNLGSLTNLVASGEGSRFGAWRHKLVRSSMILKNILEVQEVRKRFDVPRLFEEATGVSFETYLAMVFAITTNRLRKKVD